MAILGADQNELATGDENAYCPTCPRVVQQSQTNVFMRVESQILRKMSCIYVENVKFSTNVIELVIGRERFILDTRTSYGVCQIIRINSGIEFKWCMGIKTHQWNF